MNKQYIKWMLKQHKFLFIMEFICAFLFIFLLPINEVSQIEQFFNYGYSIVVISLMNAAYLVVSAFIYVLIINTKLYKKNSMDVYAALPMNKSKLTLHEYGVGCIIILIPYLISVVSLLIAMNVIFSMNNNHLYYDITTTLNTYYLGFTHSILIFMVMYSILYVLTMKAKSMVDAIVFSIGTYGCMTFAWTSMYQMLAEIQIGEVNESLNNIKDLQFVGINIASYVMNPLYSLFQVFAIFTDGNALTLTLVITMLLEIVIFILTITYMMKFSEERLNEDIQGVNHSKLGYPLTICFFISGLAFFYATAISSSTIATWMFIILISFFVYMILLSLYNRKFTFKIKYVVVFITVYALAYGMRYAYIKCDGLGAYTLYKNYDYETITIGYWDGVEYQQLKYDVTEEQKENVTLFMDACKEYTKEYYIDGSSSMYVSVELIQSYKDIQNYTFYISDVYAIDVLEELLIQYIDFE